MKEQPKAGMLDRTPLHMQLVARLRDLIMAGDLMAGEKIREQELCERFGVSRTPLREALKVLASEDIVVLTPNRGARVAEHSLDELDDAFAVMGALEALAGELAAPRITDEELTVIRTLHQQMLSHVKAGRQTPYFTANRAIHDAIFAAAGNPILQEQYRQVSARLLSARYVAAMSPARWQQAVEDHELMLDALKSRDGAELALVLKRHLTNKFETVQEWLATGDVG